MHADVPRFLGQFAGVLILINVYQTLGFLVSTGRPHLSRDELLDMVWRHEHWLVSTMMLVTGLIAVVSWDAIFPDRRDVMVLGAAAGAGGNDPGGEGGGVRGGGGDRAVVAGAVGWAWCCRW